jgi:hypothetical protein
MRQKNTHGATGNARVPRSALSFDASLIFAGLVAAATLILTVPSAFASDAPGAAWPGSATVPVNLGGSVEGKYADNTGATFDGTGYTVVDIDGAFYPNNPSFTSPAGNKKIISEACVGQKTGTAWLSLCDTTNFVSRPLWGDPSAGFYFTTQTGRSMPSNSPFNTCGDPANSSAPPFCQYFHGTATAGAIAGQSIVRWEGDTKLTVTGAAPGANVIAIKVGGGVGTDGKNMGWPINSIVDALNFVNTGLLADAQLGPAIVAVNISASGNTGLGDPVCAADSDGARINEIAGVLKSKGVAVVMTAGNDALNGSGNWTCGNNVIVVGATGILQPGVPTDYTNISQRTTLFAPVGTANRDSHDFVLLPWKDLGSFYVWGTSFASPQVAAAFAVLHQKFGRSASVDTLLRKMQSSGKKLTGPRSELASSNATVLDISAALKSSVSAPAQ